MRRVVLMGAGASIPFYEPRPTSEHLKQVLLATERWTEIVGRHATLRGDANVIDLPELLGALGTFMTWRPDANFEEIVEFLDKASSFGFPSSYGTGGKLLHNILAAHGATPLFKQGVPMDVPFLARQLIAEELASLSPSQDYLRLQALQRTFFENLLGNGEASVVSLNYDESLLSSFEGLGFATGFESGHFFARDYFVAPNVVGFPHGHVRFLPTSNGMSMAASGRTANEKRFKGLNSITMDETVKTVDSKYAYSFDTFIVTGQTKDNALNQNPFAAVYQRFAADLLDAVQVIVIGYSFGDAHLNRFLINFVERLPANRILVIDWNPGSIDFLEQWQPKQPLFNLLSNFGIDTVPVSVGPTGKAHYKFVKEIAEINDRGFGFLLPPKVLYFKAGYAAFLENPQPVLGFPGPGGLL